MTSESPFTTRVLCGVAALLLFPTLVFAQQGTIRGEVTDAENQEPLPGANVVVEGENVGAATQADGTFRITGVPTGQQTLVVSFVGYQRTERDVNVQAGETTVANFRLQPDLAGLDEVVVTGLAQEQTRGESAVSVSSIDAASITETADVQSMTDLFQGNTAGVRVSQTSGNVGSGVRFNVRSGVSLNSDGQPLIFVDGVRINQDPVNGFGAGGQETSPLADLDPSNIKSMEVLKGPAASALYGTSASDGVVLIETKSGLNQDQLQVDYRTTQGFTNRVKTYSSDIFKSAEDANGLFRKGRIQSHRISASGTIGDDINFFTSYSNRRTDGIIRKNEGAQNNFQANFEAQPGDDWTIQANTSVAINDFKRPENDNNLFGQLGNTLLALNGTPYFFTDSTSVFSISDDQRVQRFRGSVQATYEPSEVPGLRINGRIGSDVASRRQDKFFPSTSTFSGISDGEKNVFETDNRQFNGEVSASYTYDVTPNITATSTGGGQAFTESTTTAFLDAQELSTDILSNAAGGVSLENLGESRFNERSAGFFGRQQFTFFDNYTLSGSARRDFSSKLIGGGTSNFNAWYPSVRASAQLDHLDVIPDVFTQFKLRGAFGQTGELPGLNDADPLRLTGERSGFGTGATIGSVGQEGLETETVTEYEGGIDLTVNERYSLSATYYYQSTSESIVQFQPAPSTGFGAFNQPRNVGQVDGQGVELEADATVFRTQKHSVSVNANYSYTYAEVKDLDGQIITGGFDNNVIKEGIAPKSFFGLEVDGAERVTQDGTVIPNFVDQDGDGDIDTDDRVKLGNPIPDHSGGFGINVQLYDDFTISGQAEYRLGHQIFNGTREFAQDLLNDAELTELQGRLAQLNRGSEEFQNVADRIAELDGSDRAFGNFLENADWLKLRNVSITYDFTDEINRFVNTPLRNFRIGFSGQNLVTITDYSGPDPEINQTGSRSISEGRDFLTLQNGRQFTWSLSVGF